MGLQDKPNWRHTWGAAEEAFEDAFNSEGTRLEVLEHRLAKLEKAVSRMETELGRLSETVGGGARWPTRTKKSRNTPEG